MDAILESAILESYDITVQNSAKCCYVSLARDLYVQAYNYNRIRKICTIVFVRWIHNLQW